MAVIKKFGAPEEGGIPSHLIEGPIAFIKKFGGGGDVIISRLLPEEDPDSVFGIVKKRVLDKIGDYEEGVKEGVEWVVDKGGDVIDAVPSPDDITDWLDQWKIPLLIAGAGVLLLVAAPNIKALRSD